MPDLIITEIGIEDLYKNEYIKTFFVKIKNKGKFHYSPLDLKIYSSSNLGYEKELRFDSICFEREEKKTFSLDVSDRIRWPKDLPVLSFIAHVDNTNKIEEFNESNNSKARLRVYRGDLLSHCDVEVLGPISIDGRIIREDNRVYTFPIKNYDHWIGFRLMNPCSAIKTSKLLVVYDAENLFVSHGKLNLGLCDRSGLNEDRLSCAFRRIGKCSDLDRMKSRRYVGP